MEDKTVDTNVPDIDNIPRPGDGTHVGAMLAQVEPELTDRQVQIVKMRMRGLTQTAIANVLGITQSTVAKHLKAIKEKFSHMGATVDQSLVVGESVNLFQEVEQRGWELYYLAKEKGKVGDANKALNLLMDLGLLKRAAVEHEHKVNASPLIKQWEEGKAQKQLVVTSIVETQLEQLAPPEPPEEIEEAEWSEVGEENEDSK